MSASIGAAPSLSGEQRLSRQLLLNFYDCVKAICGMEHVERRGLHTHTPHIPLPPST